jgi:hypothetical protein
MARSRAQTPITEQAPSASEVVLVAVPTIWREAIPASNGCFLLRTQKMNAHGAARMLVG